MLLKFTKMHGAGNDFVVVDLISQRCRLRPGDVRRIADRHYGIGCDQVLLVDFLMQVRDIARFDSAQRLVEQLDQDINTIRTNLAPLSR